MVQPAGTERMRQGTDDVLLADERFKVPGTVFAGEDLIGHDRILPQTGRREVNNRFARAGTALD
ncbi:hypothetical protein GCM10007388_18670 [Pseudoduganella plicata]|uniref:Uncharacterized protein n=1 Tax=Pseudoduganella plicata TaxID=321984 RepID=A0AA87Y252_9BURK|nr:hypothetical protein GCM10007388_18670 [Pseudoduganella plicata]